VYREQEKTVVDVCRFEECPTYKQKHITELRRWILHDIIAVAESIEQRLMSHKTEAK